MFHCGTSAAEIARTINDVYGEGIVIESTVKRFPFDLLNKPMDGRRSWLAMKN